MARQEGEGEIARSCPPFFFESTERKRGVRDMTEKQLPEQAYKEFKLVCRRLLPRMDRIHRFAATEYVEAICGQLNDGENLTP
jgi:hypothetical protein